MRNLSGYFFAAFFLMCAPSPIQAAVKSKATAKNTQRVPMTGKTFRDCPGCPDMVVIPAGRFDMGSPESEDGRDDDEGPVRRVKIAAFALGKTEITRGQFAAFVKESGYNAGDTCWTFAEGTFKEREGNWRNPGYWQNDNHPVTCVSWNDAQAYARWLSRKTGRQYRLPSEAEWEYAARGRTRRARYWGDNPDMACKYANVADQTAKAKIPGSLSWLAHECTDRFAYTAPVGRFRPNAFGLRDMLGNVWEWTTDVYYDSYEGAPADGSARLGEGAKHTLRGGSWNSDPQNVRAAIRNSNKSTLRFSLFGFRLARKLP